MLTDENNQTALFNLNEIDFHAPSEHTFDELNYDLELQFIHKNAGGGIAIVSVFFDIDEGGDQ